MSYPGKIGIVGGGSRKTLSQMALQYNRPTNLFNVYTPGAGVQSGGRASNPGIRRALARRAQLKPGTMDKPHTGRCGGLCDKPHKPIVYNIEIIYLDGITNYYRIEGILDTSNPIFKNAKSVTIFSDITRIYNSYLTNNIIDIFYGIIPRPHYTIENIIIPTSVTSISNFTFAYNQLTSLIIPDSVTTIGEYAFAYNNLTSVTIPNSVTTIGEYAFFNNYLTSVNIQNPVTRIGEYAFSNNYLTSVIIPDYVTTISDYAFFNNYLTSVIIPDYVKYISKGAFASNNLTSVNIPNSVTTIGEFAFADNSLNSVTIPNSVTNIGDYAFSINYLKDIIFEGNVLNISLGTKIFNNQTISGNITIRSNASYGIIDTFLIPQFGNPPPNLVFTYF